MVREGDIIHAGKPLLQIANWRESVSLGDTQAAVAEQLQIKSSRLQSDLNQQARLEDLARQDLQTRVFASQQQMAQLRDQIYLQRQRADSAMALCQEWLKVFETGLVSKAQLLQQHDSALENAGRVKELKSQLLQVQQQTQQLKTRGFNSEVQQG